MILSIFGIDLVAVGMLATAARLGDSPPILVASRILVIPPAVKPTVPLE